MVAQAATDTAPPCCPACAAATECACLADTGSCVSKGAVLLPSIPLLNGTAGCPCSSCSAKGDANAVAMCVGGRCQSSCVFGTFRCDASGACLDKYASDVTSCGASCKACPKPEFGRATCVLGSCDVVCNAGYTRAVNAGKPSCTPRTLVDAVTYSNLSSPFTTWIGGYGVLAGLDSAKRTWTTRFPEVWGLQRVLLRRAAGVCTAPDNIQNACCSSSKVPRVSAKSCPVCR